MSEPKQITQDDAAELRELYDKLCETLEEMKRIVRGTMTAREYDNFRYNVLGHIEGGISQDFGWVGHHKTLEDVVLQAEEDAETAKCKKCQSALDAEGFCKSETCPYKNLEQDENPDEH